MYQLLKQKEQARRGEFITNRGTVQTPAFMNVATAAAMEKAKKCFAFAGSGEIPTKQKAY